MLVVSKNVSFCQSKIQQEDVVAVLIGSHAKVAWMQVAVQHFFAVDILYDRNHLLRKV